MILEISNNYYMAKNIKSFSVLNPVRQRSNFRCALALKLIRKQNFIFRQSLYTPDDFFFLGSVNS